MGKQRKKNGRWVDAPPIVRIHSESEEKAVQETSTDTSTENGLHQPSMTDNNSEQLCVVIENLPSCNGHSHSSPAPEGQGNGICLLPPEQGNGRSPDRDGDSTIHDGNEQGNGHSTIQHSNPLLTSVQNSKTSCQVVVRKDSSLEPLKSPSSDDHVRPADNPLASSVQDLSLSNHVSHKAHRISAQNDSRPDADSSQLANACSDGNLSSEATRAQKAFQNNSEGLGIAGSGGAKRPYSAVHNKSSAVASQHDPSGQSSKCGIGQGFTQHGQSKHQSGSVDPLQDLKVYIERLGGSLEEGWTVRTNKKYKFYISPDNKKFIARIQVARYLGVLPHQKGGKKQINAEQSIISQCEVQNTGEDPLKSLTEYIENLGGYLSEGWRFEQHKTYIAYFSPSNRKFTAKHQVAEYLGLHFHSELQYDNLQITALPNHKANVQSGNTSANGPHQDSSNQKRESGALDGKLGASASPSLPLKENMANDVYKSSPVDKESSLSVLLTQRCEEVLRSIICAETFASLSKLLSCGLQPGCLGDTSKSKNSTLFTGALDLQLISLRLSTGAYGRTPEMFSTDMQQVWSDITRVGQELVSLSASLSKLSDSLYKEQVLSLLQTGSKEKSPASCSPSNGILLRDSKIATENAEPCERVTEGQDSLVKNVCKLCGIEEDIDCLTCTMCNAIYHSSCITESFSSRDSWCCSSCLPGHADGDITKLTSNNVQKKTSTMSLQSRDEVSETTTGPSKITAKGGICKTCGKADDLVLLCDSCDAAYHMSCVTPVVDHVPDGFWYCPECAEAQKKKSLVSTVVSPEEHHCAVCDRIRSDSSIFIEETLENGSPNVKDKTESEWNAEVNDVGTGSSEEQYHDLEIEVPCKLCGVTDESAQIHCSGCARCYHVICLGGPVKKLAGGIWYCPSCLCRVCEIDVDDDKILLCDGCDEGYHTYCLSPPLKTIPKGAWFCNTCTAYMNPSPKPTSTLPTGKTSSEGSNKKKRKHPGG